MTELSQRLNPDLDRPAEDATLADAGACARFRCAGRRGHRARARTSSASSRGWTPAFTATWTTCSGTARCAAARRSWRPGRCASISVRMNYWPRTSATGRRRARPTLRTAYVSRYALGRDYHKVMRRRARAPRRGPGASDRAFRLSRLRGQRARARKGAGAQCRARLDRQAHEPPRAGCGLVFLPRRDTYGPATATGCARQRALRHMRGVHSGLPDAGDRRPLPAGCAALHLVSHDRAQGGDSGGAAHGARQSHLRLRRLPARVPLEQVRARWRRIRISKCVTGWTRRSSPSCSRWTRSRNSTSACAARAIYRIGYERWSRNIAVALGNAPSSPEVIAALLRRRDRPLPARARARGVGARPASRRASAPDLEVVDEARLAEARRDEHDEVPRVRCGAMSATFASRTEK